MVAAPPGYLIGPQNTNCHCVVNESGNVLTAASFVMAERRTKPSKFQDDHFTVVGVRPSVSSHINRFTVPPTIGIIA